MFKINIKTGYMPKTIEDAYLHGFMFNISYTLDKLIDSCSRSDRTIYKIYNNLDTSEPKYSLEEISKINDIKKNFDENLDKLINEISQYNYRYKQLMNELIKYEIVLDDNIRVRIANADPFTGIAEPVSRDNLKFYKIANTYSVNNGPSGSIKNRDTYTDTTSVEPTDNMIKNTYYIMDRNDEYIKELTEVYKIKKEKEQEREDIRDEKIKAPYKDVYVSTLLKPYIDMELKKYIETNYNMNELKEFDNKYNTYVDKIDKENEYKERVYDVVNTLAGRSNVNNIDLKNNIIYARSGCVGKVIGKGGSIIKNINSTLGKNFKVQEYN